MKQLEPESVACMEGFLVFAIFEYPDAPVRQHTIAVHQEQLDAGRTCLNIGRGFSHRYTQRTQVSKCKAAREKGNTDEAVQLKNTDHVTRTNGLLNLEQLDTLQLQPCRRARNHQ